MSIRKNILEAMRLDLNELRLDVDAPLNLKEVSLYDENILELGTYEKPMIMLLDSFGEEEIHTDGTDSVALWGIGLIGVVDGTNGDDLLDSRNRMVALIKRYIKSKPSLPQVYSLKYRRTNTRSYKERIMADIMVEVDVLYYTESGTY